ncbi:MAG TPA: TonB-dependent siderophore receptor [Rudaea sp.]|jgi:catecholate siderophore receptor|nr:TonB-dependent siderophore receptor [Rudaea sp.]
MPIGINTLKPLCAALALALITPAVHAADAGADVTAADAGNGQVLDKVDVTATTSSYSTETTSIGKVQTPVHDLPQTVNIVNQELLHAEGATSFADALRNVPGITIGGAEGGQIGNNINLRGFTARTDIYIDGVRDRGQYYRDTFDLEQIEVLKGPSSMLFGRGSTGGVINQVTKQPILNELDEVIATVGTDDRYRVAADLNQPLSDTSAGRVNVFAQDNHSTRDVMSNKDGGLAPSLRFGIGTPTEITLSALLQRNHDMPDYGIPPLNGKPAPIDLDNFYGLTDDRTNQDVAMGSLRVDHTFSDALDLKNQLQYNWYRTDAQETAPNNLVGTDGTLIDRTKGNYTDLPLDDILVQLASHDRIIHDTSFDNQTDLVAKFATGAIAHTLLTGIELAHDTYENQAYARSGLPLLSLLDPVYLPQAGNVVQTPGNNAYGTANTAAVYANDTVKFNDQWQAVAGLRRDRYAAMLDNSVSAPAQADQTVYFTSRRAGLIFQPSYEQSYYVSYGTSFDPSLETLTVTNNTQALPPEKNRSYEVGAKWDLFNDKLDLTAAVFDVEKTNARTQVSATEYELSGDIRVRGGEIGASGHVTDAWQIFAGYTRLNATIVKASDGTQGDTPANTPRNSVSVWNSVKLSPQWEIGGGAVYLSQRYAANNDLVSVPGYTRWDAMIAWHQPKYTVQLNMLNIGDKKYIDALIPSDGGRSIPGIGRTLLATFDYKF